MAHLHSVYDTDNHFLIDSVTRSIKNESKKTTVVQYDHNSERFTFQLPRYIDGHDMLQCNKAEVHYLNVDNATKQKQSGRYDVDDLQISPDDENTVICSWLISGNATQYAGQLSFLLRLCCMTDYVIDYAWNTKPHTEVYVSDGLNISEAVAEEYKDVLEQWKAELFAAGYINASDMQSDITALNSALAVERARIDAFVALEDGSTTGDAELQDIRISANGITYNSAGTAVREQFNDVAKKFSVLGDFEADTSGWEPVNVIDGYSWGEAGYTYNANGDIVSTEYTKNFTPLDQLVPAVPGASYLTSGFVGQVRIYSADKTQLDLLLNNAMAYQLSFTAPAEAAYFGIYYRHDIITTEEMISAIKLFRTSLTAEEYAVCEIVLNNGRIPGSAMLDNSIGLEKLSDDAGMVVCSLDGKTIVNFGDSIFGNARPPEDVSTYLAALTGATVHNCGFGGCRMSYHPSANYDAFSMTKLADAVASNDFSVQDAAIANTEGDSVPDYFVESVELLKSIDFNLVDIITIAYGSNDFNGVTLENADNSLDQRTFAGALRYSIETILVAYPHIRIFVCSPTYRFWMDDNYAFTEDSDTKMGGANYLTTDIVEKAKEVAKEYKLSFIDNYYSLGINKFNRSQYFPTTDGAHHNINGRKLIAANMAKELF